MSVRQVLWAAALRNKPLRERLPAIAGAGFTHTSVFPDDMTRWRQEGLSDRRIGQLFRDAGIGVVAVDPFAQWVPGFRLDDFPDASFRAFVDHDEEAVLAMAEALAAPRLNVVSFSGAAFHLAAYADALGGLADRAAARGIALTFEFMPLFNVADLEATLALLDAVGSARIGITFDTWHFHRGNPDIDLLRTIDGERIAEIQLADAAREVHGDLANDLMHFRKVPGDGEFDLERTVGALKDIGAWRSVGPEIFSDELDHLGADDAAMAARAGLDRFA